MIWNYKVNVMIEKSETSLMRNLLLYLSKKKNPLSRRMIMVRTPCRLV